MGEVRRLTARRNLLNIPHALRALADDLEAGAEPMPRTVLLVAIGDPNEPPVVFGFGQDTSRLEEVGALASALSQAQATE